MLLLPVSIVQNFLHLILFFFLVFKEKIFLFTGQYKMRKYVEMVLTFGNVHVVCSNIVRIVLEVPMVEEVVENQSFELGMVQILETIAETVDMEKMVRNCCRNFLQSLDCWSFVHISLQVVDRNHYYLGMGLDYYLEYGWLEKSLVDDIHHRLVLFLSCDMFHGHCYLFECISVQYHRNCLRSLNWLMSNLNEIVIFFLVFLTNLIQMNENWFYSY